MFISEQSIKLSIKDPNGDTISFEVINFEERQKLMNSEVDSLFKIDRTFFRNEIYRLKDGSLLHIYTADAYVFRFYSESELNKFINNDDHFTASVIFEKKDNHFYYMFSLHNDKSAELIKNTEFEIEGYPNKSPMFDYKLYRLKNGTFLRVWERAKDVYSGSWFPNLETFEWFYFNNYAS
jgi:hypothetical protein